MNKLRPDIKVCIPEWDPQERDFSALEKATAELHFNHKDKPTDNKEKRYAFNIPGQSVALSSSWPCLRPL
eukprot:4041151-Pleurochrysis_carterae.AAC.2